LRHAARRYCHLTNIRLVVLLSAPCLVV
jgi:hypothetical protein